MQKGAKYMRVLLISVRYICSCDNVYYMVYKVHSGQPWDMGNITRIQHQVSFFFSSNHFFCAIHCVLLRHVFFVALQACPRIFFLPEAMKLPTVKVYVHYSALLVPTFKIVSLSLCLAISVSVKACAYGRDLPVDM